MFNDLRADSHRFLGPSPRLKARILLLFNQGFAAVVCYRCGRWLADRRFPPGLRHVLGAAYFLYWKAVETGTGISIPPDCRIGPGLYIGHFGQIILNPQVVIGRNCNLSQGVTIGEARRGDEYGSPRLGDRVYVAPGAKIIGPIRLGDGTAVGANAVVTRDSEPNAVLVGVPAAPVSDKGSERLIQNPVPPAAGHQTDAGSTRDMQ
jgi:serine O-acetyltransferase